MAIDLVIFDCDGVLIDSEVIACGISAAFWTKAGYPITTEEFLSRFAGMSRKSMDRIVSEETSEDIIHRYNDMEAEKKALLWKEFEESLQITPYIEEVLQSITLPKCVASSSEMERLEHSLGLTGLWDMFDGNIFSSTMVEHGKPAPDLFLHAAKTMGASPENCLVIEDSVAGVTAAKSAGMRAVGYTAASHMGPQKVGLLEQVGAWQITDDIRHILDILKTENRRAA